MHYVYTVYKEGIRYTTVHIQEIPHQMSRCIAEVSPSIRCPKWRYHQLGMRYQNGSLLLHLFYGTMYEDVLVLDIILPDIDVMVSTTRDVDLLSTLSQLLRDTGVWYLIAYTSLLCIPLAHALVVP